VTSLRDAGKRLAKPIYLEMRARRFLRSGGPASFADRWWYYTVELAPGVIARGQFEPDFPMLPRMMLRRCNLDGAECLDMGTMEAIVPTLMRRSGAAKVLAVDFGPHCTEKIAAVKAAYEVDFNYKNVGPMDGLFRKIRAGFDLINCSGLLYHVWSPLHVLAGVRPLLRRNGLMIVNTNVVLERGMRAEFNAEGRMQEEVNTFWYPTIELLQYQLQYLRLEPIDAMLVPHDALASKVRYRFAQPSGILCVLCRATDEPDGDSWIARSARESWEYRSFSDWDRADRQGVSAIAAESNNPIVLVEEAEDRIVPGSVDVQDSHVLHLTDRS